MRQHADTSILDAYPAANAAAVDKLIARAENYMPGLRGHIVALDIATPACWCSSTRPVLPGRSGCSDTKSAGWQQRVPFVEGLYLAGHWVGPSDIYNVAQSGKNAAELILRN